MTASKEKEKIHRKLLQPRIDEMAQITIDKWIKLTHRKSQPFGYFHFYHSHLVDMMHQVYFILRLPCHHNHKKHTATAIILSHDIHVHTPPNNNNNNIQNCYSHSLQSQQKEKTRYTSSYQNKSARNENDVARGKEKNWNELNENKFITLNDYLKRRY